MGLAPSEIDRLTMWQWTATRWEFIRRHPMAKEPMPSDEEIDEMMSNLRTHALPDEVV